MLHKKEPRTSLTPRQHEIDPQRRRCLRALGSAVLIGTLGPVASGGSAWAVNEKTKVYIVRFSNAGKKLGRNRVSNIVKSAAEWQKQLSHEAYVVTRHEGTEPAYSGQYWDSKADGLYRCICCNTALYDSHTKFHSGTGWPSFWQPIAHENILARTDHSFWMTRTKIACKRCNAHLGHVFNDGPQPTGLRYCMNSVALHFVPRTHA